MIRIQLQNVTKEFPPIHKRDRALLHKFATMFREESNVCVLKDISLEIRSGEMVGIVGRNGAGKSTLLRLVAGIHKPSTGRVVTNGNVISLIGLYAGLELKLTVEENVQLCCALFGLTSRETIEKMDSILMFAELEEYRYTPLRQVSNGMMQRLVFAVAIACNPDILLLDEVFEIGDDSFKQKSVNEITALSERGGCVLLVSHDDQLIKKYTSRTVVIEHGSATA